MLPLNKTIHVESYKELIQERSYQEALCLLREKRFSKKDLGISYRELNYWSELGLLFEENIKGKWRKYDTIELIWIELLKELRYYNLPIIVLRGIKETVGLPIPYGNIVEEIGIEEFEALMKAHLTEEQYEKVINSEDHQLLRKTKKLHGLEELMPKNLFEYFVLEAYFLKFQYNVIINYNGRLTFLNQLYEHETINQPYYKENFEKSHLSISLNSLISKIFNDYSVKDLKLKWKLINEDEDKILDVIQSGKQLKSISIKFNNQSKIDLLEYKELMDISIDQYIKSLIVKGAFEEIKIVTQKGKIVVCEKTTKRKI